MCDQVWSNNFCVTVGKHTIIFTRIDKNDNGKLRENAEYKNWLFFCMSLGLLFGRSQCLGIMTMLQGEQQKKNTRNLFSGCRCFLFIVSLKFTMNSPFLLLMLIIYCDCFFSPCLSLHHSYLLHIAGLCSHSSRIKRMDVCAKSNEREKKNDWNIVSSFGMARVIVAMTFWKLAVYVYWEKEKKSSVTWMSETNLIFAVAMCVFFSFLGLTAISWLYIRR